MPSRSALLVQGLVLTAALAGAFAPALARAQIRAYVIAVPTEEGLEPVAARVGAAARASLRNITEVNSAGPDQAFLGYDQFMVERLSRARERLDAGRQAYLNLELPTAIEALAGAVEDFDSAAPALEDPTDLGEALLFLGASQVFDGKTRDARRTFERLHVQMPYLDPDPNLFNPDILAEYERARPRRGGNGSITVDSEPTGAIVYLDYVARGRTPVTIDGLHDGSHTVRVTRPGATPFVQQVSLRRGNSEQVTAFLEDNAATPGLADSIAALREHPLEQMEEGDALSRVAVALELDKLGVIQVSPGDGDEQVRLRFVMFDIASGAPSPALVGPVPTAFGQLESGVQQLVSQGLRVALTPNRQGEDSERIPAQGGGEQGPGFTQRGTERSPEIWEEWWFWTAVGGVVVAGVILGVVLASQGGQDLGSRPGGQIILEF